MYRCRTVLVRSLVLTHTLCFRHGTEDHGVPIAGSEYMVKTVSPDILKDSEFHKLPGAYHDLLAEPNAEENAAILLKFIEKRLNKKK